MFIKQMEKQDINIVWFKRDLRFTDHEPLFLAQQSSRPTLLIYCFEPSLIEYDDSDERHWRFVYESLVDMNGKLKSIDSEIYIFHSEVIPVLEKISTNYNITHLFSHQEIGNKISYDRDLTVQSYCDKHQIQWQESQTNGVIRKLKSRTDWEKRWKSTMLSAPKIINETNWNLIKLPTDWYNLNKGPILPLEFTTSNEKFQKGGETLAWKYLESFLKNRCQNYSKHISKPELSRKGCSRLSPYLTYGNISMRMVYQFTLQHYKDSKHKRALTNFISRLHWHCHFIQKFEDECSMEFEPINKSYNSIQKTRNEAYIKAWQTGKTGVPLVDACMRCLVGTGFINFRMRAMVVSFFVFNLWQDWRDLQFLTRQFLDYEPGIHYPQIHMQAGITGVNTVRIYNPIKNSEEHDSEGDFTKNGVPNYEKFHRI
jgi:deoxyribodipyrimidine photo-lyase